MARWNLKGEGEQGRSVRGQLRLTDESTPHTVQAARGAVGADEGARGRDDRRRDTL